MKIFALIFTLALFLKAAAFDAGWKERELSLDALLAMNDANIRVAFKRAAARLAEHKSYENRRDLTALWLDFMIAGSSKLVYLLNLEKNIEKINYTLKSLDKQAIKLEKCDQLFRLYKKSSQTARIMALVMDLYRVKKECDRVDKRLFKDDLQFKRASFDLRKKIQRNRRKLNSDLAKYFRLAIERGKLYEYFNQQLGMSLF